MNLRLALSLTLLFPLTLFAVQPDDFPFIREIKQPVKAGQVYTLDIDQGIWEALNEDMSNLRLYDQDNSELPFVLRRKFKYKRQTERQLVNATLLSTSKPENESIELIYSLKESHAIEMITIQTQNRDFENAISVYGSADQNNWELLTEDTIFDYSSLINHQKLNVSIPSSTYLYFKIKLNTVLADIESSMVSLKEVKGLNQNQVTEYQKAIFRRNFKVDTITFHAPVVRYEPQDYQQETMTPSWSLTVDEQTDQYTSILVDLIGPDPISATIRSNEAVLNRPLSIAFYDHHHQVWRNISSYTMKTDANNQYELPFDAHSNQRVKITIDNRDDKPVTIRDFTIDRQIYQLIFIPYKNGHVTAYFGGKSQGHPSYEIQSHIWSDDFIPKLRHASSLAWSKDVKDNPSHRENLSSTETYTYVLKIALALLVITLLGAVVFISKKVEVENKN